MVSSRSSAIPTRSKDTDMAEIRDPGPEAVEKIFEDLEGLELQPAVVARHARRLRAHVEALREEIDRLTPRYAQPCDRHEYIDPQCPDCGRMEKAV